MLEETFPLRCQLLIHPTFSVLNKERKDSLEGLLIKVSWSARAPLKDKQRLK